MITVNVWPQQNGFNCGTTSLKFTSIATAFCTCTPAMLCYAMLCYAMPMLCYAVLCCRQLLA
eukprot:COSAG06_NODE_20888_length_777_cov_1.628319_1_plen_61_part_10